MLSKSKLKIFVLTLLILGGALVGYYTKTVLEYSRYPLYGKKAPKFSLATYSSEQFSFDVGNGNAPTVITLWAPQCGECAPYLDYIKYLNEKYEHINFVGLAYKSQKSDVEKWLIEHKNTFDIILDDQEGKVANQFKFFGLPESVFVDRNGKITKWDVTRPKPSLVDFLNENSDNI